MTTGAWSGAHLPGRIRQARPLVHAITNLVTMDWVARGLLAAGARPVMARDPAEAGLMAGTAAALVLNLGTWSPEVHAAMLAAGQAANARGIPVVLDPVGAGGIETRTRAALDLLAHVRVAAIRGNAGEIGALAGRPGLVSGVDDRSPGRHPRAAAQSARLAAVRHRCVVAATGPVDAVSDGTRTLEVRSGHPLLARIPGAGCLATALIAAGLAAVGTTPSPLDTVVQSLLLAGVAGEQAAAGAPGPGSFAVAYLDALAAVSALPDHDRITLPLADRLSLYAIVSGTTPPDTVRAILAAGAGAVQFREKQLPLGAQVEAARRLRSLCREAGALFVVNDRMDLALAVQADGVHLGQDDLPVSSARLVLGPGAIIGATCETPAEAVAATQAGADYIGTGPVYATGSKADAGHPYGPAVVERVARATDLPVVGIGGIAPGTAAAVIAAGACGVAVISAVVGAPDPAGAARALLSEVAQTKEVLY